MKFLAQNALPIVSVMACAWLVDTHNVFAAMLLLLAYLTSRTWEERR